MSEGFRILCVFVAESDSPEDFAVLDDPPKGAAVVAVRRFLGQNPIDEHSESFQRSDVVGLHQTETIFMENVAPFFVRLHPRRVQGNRGPDEQRHSPTLQSTRGGVQWAIDRRDAFAVED